MTPIEDALHRFSINLESFIDIRGPDEKNTKALHTEVKRRFRALALEIHPDVKGDHNEMIRLTEARDLLLQCSLQRERPQPARRVIHIPMGSWYSTGGTFSTVTMTSSWTRMG